MPKITLDYEVLLTVKVDTDTGDIEYVCVHPEDFNGSLPARYFTGGLDSELPEYLEPGHPIARKALTIAESILTRCGDLAVPWERRR